MGTTSTSLNPPDASAAHWYVVWTRARHERAVARQLLDKQVETFLPTIKRWSQWSDRRKSIDWPLFPCYCFARFDPLDTRRIASCVGVQTIVSFGGQPKSVSDVEIDSLRILVDNILPYDPCPTLSEGQKVSIVDGPLRGVVGRLLKKDRRHASVILAVELIGQAARVEVDASDVRPL